MLQFCGIDIIEVDRVKKAILNTPGFREKVFTKKEIEVGENKSDLQKYQYYAGRFAAKEAVYKALSSKFGDKLWLGDIEILNDSKLLNRPYVVLKNIDLETMQEQGILNIDVSISHIEKYAMSSAVVSI
mgnify:CR=1 FL=1